MSSQRYTSKAMPAFKLMAAENEYHRRNEMLAKEIRKLRGEVGVMARWYLQARKEINQLITKVKSQPPPIIPVRIEKEEKNEEGVVEEEDTEMEGMEMKEKEKEELIKSDYVPTPRKPISPLPVPPPPPPPSPEHTINLEKAWKHAGKQGEKATTVSQPNTVACATDKTPPAAPAEAIHIQTKIEKAAETAMSRYEVWERAVKGYLEGRRKKWESYEEYVSDDRPGYLCNDIGQWSIENDRKVVTRFDRWGWRCVINSKGSSERRGKLWLMQVKEAKKGGTVNMIFKK